MKDIIYQKMNSITNLQDRVLFKELLNDVFIALYEHNEEMYKTLEKRVFDEVDYDQKSYNLYTGLVSLKEYDPIHYFLCPMLEEDPKPKEYDLSYILECIRNEQEYNMFKIFIKGDYLLYRQLLEEKQTFKGEIKTNKKTYSASFILKENRDYWQEVYKLYKTFLKNDIPWITINAPYISKMMDVCLVETEGLIGEEEIIEVKVDFGEYSQYVEYDMIPLWNVKRLDLESTGFPMPCEDHVNFEHTVGMSKYGLQNGYLIEDSEDQVKYIKHNAESITIVGPVADAQAWPVYRVIKPIQTKMHYDAYPVMSNAKKVSFAEKLQNSHQTHIKTKAELMRLIQGFEVEKYLEFKEIKIMDRAASEVSETYSMNPFIVDEIRDDDYHKLLVLYFKTEVTDLFIIRDLLSFIVSEVQAYYPEYQCEGKLL